MVACAVALGLEVARGETRITNIELAEMEGDGDGRGNDVVVVKLVGADLELGIQLNFACIHGGLSDAVR
jgi:hypothetical protein